MTSRRVLPLIVLLSASAAAQDVAYRLDYVGIDGYYRSVPRNPRTAVLDEPAASDALDVRLPTAATRSMRTTPAT